MIYIYVKPDDPCSLHDKHQLMNMQILFEVIAGSCCNTHANA